MVDLALQVPPTLGYVGLTLAIPVFVTALIAVACGLLFVVAAALGISLDSRAATTLTVAPLVALVVWALERAIVALRRRLPPGPIVTLEEVSARALAPDKVGPKAHALARMRSHGARVAPGWVLCSSVFEAAGALRSEGDELGACPPTKLLRRLLRTLDASGEPEFLIRSSFAGEDEVSGAAPGIYTSVVWARSSGLSGLEAAIRTVWASYRAERARAYRRERSEAETPKLALLLQPCLAHERHGVASSVDLVRGGRDVHLIDAGDWLGAHRLLTDSVEELSSVGGAQALRDEVVRAISRLAGLAEHHLGAPAEIEWGLNEDRVTLYQARVLSGAPCPRTLTNRHIVELPRYPLSPLSHSFLWGDEAPARVLNAALTPLGLPALPESSMVVVEGRVMLDVTPFKPLLLGLRGAAGLSTKVTASALLGLSGQRSAEPPKRPDMGQDALRMSELVERLQALRSDALIPALAKQVRAMTLGASLEGWLRSRVGSDAVPLPRIARPDDGDAWYRAEHAAELSAPRQADGSPEPTPVAPSQAQGGGASLWVGWVAWARDRHFTEREALNAQIQAINVEARARALALDDLLSQEEPEWERGDVFFCTLAELSARAQEGAPLPPRRPRRARFDDAKAAEVPGVCELEAGGGWVARRSEPVRGEQGTRGIAIGHGVLKAPVVVLREGGATPPEALTGRLALVFGGSPVWSRHVMAASGLILADAGPLSHLGLLAREHGVPLIAGLDGDLEALQDGDLLSVDFDRATLKREG